MGNQAKNSAADAAASAAANAPQINPQQVGSASLNAQQALTPQTLALEQLYGPQFGNVANQNLMSGLLGTQGKQQTYQQDPNFSKLPQDVQQFLSSNPNVVSQLQGKNGVDQMSTIYKAMGNPLASPEDADAFNQWSSSKFGNWHETGTAPGLEALQSWSSGTGPGAAQGPAPGLVDILGQVNQTLNPGVSAGLSKINTAAGIAPATITAPNVAAGPNAGALQGMMGGTAPQVQGAGSNAGVDALAQLMGGNGGFTSITPTQVGTPVGANMAGPAAQATIPGMTSASQASYTGSQAPVSVQAPSAIANLTGTNVTAPTSYDKIAAPTAVGNISGPGAIDQITAPTAVGNVTAQTGFDKIQAPGAVGQVQAPGAVANVQAPGAVANVNAPSAVTVGRNAALDQLTGQGFSANRPIQQSLEQQALSDLGLGNQMNPDQIRAAQQASRAATGARGMIGSNGSVLDEMQRQFNVSNQLQNERRGFAANVENQGFNQFATQQGQGANVAGLANQYLGLGVNAQQSNAANQLSAAQGNQQAGLTTAGQGLQAAQGNQNAALTTAGQGLQAGIANQGAQVATNAQGLQAGVANQGAQQQSNALNLQGQMANQSTGLANNAQTMQAQSQNQQLAQFMAQMGFNVGAQNQQTGLANNAQQLQAGVANQGAAQAMAQLGMQGQIANQGNAFNVGAQNQQTQLAQGNQALQAGMANSANTLQNNQFNAGQSNNQSQFNTGQTNAQQLAMQQLLGQLGMFNSGQANQTSQFNAGQQDSARNAALQAGTTNAQFGQQANLANQAGQLQGFGQNASAAQAMAQLLNQQTGLNQNAQQANQGAYLQNQGQQMSALTSLMGADNQLGMFNASNNMGAQQFNAGQQQQGFQNLLGAQQANQNAAINPMQAVALQQQTAQPQYFNAFDPAIMAMYAGNQANATGAGIAAGNNSAAMSAAQQQAMAQLLAGGMNAYGMSQYGGG